MSKTFAAVVSLFIALGSLQAAETFKVGAFTFSVPEGWTKVEPSSQMRAAQLEIVKDSAKAEITFFHFNGGAGTAADNVKRWFSQFPGSEAKQKTDVVESGPVKVTFATTEGTFNSGMPGAPATPVTDSALCGAILEDKSGDVYVKMTGPEALVKSAVEAFHHMIMDAAKTAVAGA